MSKWSFGDVILVPEILFTATLGFSIEIPDFSQINDDQYIYFLELFSLKDSIYNLTLETNTYTSFPVYYLYYCCCK